MIVEEAADMLSEGVDSVSCTSIRFWSAGFVLYAFLSCSEIGPHACIEREELRDNATEKAFIVVEGSTFLFGR
jgi:hypothetical protein